MKYFIGYLIEGEAAEWHRATAAAIAERFGIWKIHEEYPPHMTIIRPFETGDISTIVRSIKIWMDDGPLIKGTITMDGFGRFDDNVIFAITRPDLEAQHWVEDFRQDMAYVPGIPEPEYRTWHPHATLAFRLPKEQIEAIWHYTALLPAPRFEMPFDNVTLFKQDPETKRYRVERMFRPLR